VKRRIKGVVKILDAKTGMHRVSVLIAKAAKLKCVDGDRKLHTRKHRAFGGI